MFEATTSFKALQTLAKSTHMSEQVDAIALAVDTLHFEVALTHLNQMAAWLEEDKIE